MTAMPAAVAMVRPVAAVMIALARSIAAVMVAVVIVMITITMMVAVTLAVMIAHLRQRRRCEADRPRDENRGTDTRYPHLCFP